MGNYERTSNDVDGVYWAYTGTGRPGLRERAVGYIDGKYLSTTWDFTGCGYYWYDECQTRIGYLIDKVLALDVLSSRRPTSPAATPRSTSASTRSATSSRTRSRFEQKFGALLTGSIHGIGPVFDKDAGGDWRPLQRSWSDARGLPEPRALDPSAGFTIQLYAGVYGLAGFPTTFDREYIDNTPDLRGRQRRGAGRRLGDPRRGDRRPSKLVSAGGTRSGSSTPTRSAARPTPRTRCRRRA